MSDTFYITTPLYYVNARPHLGHAYTTIAADALCRYHRLAGRDVFFLTGTDEHGQKVERAAAEGGLEPKAYADAVVAEFQELWRALGIEYDDFIRTTEERHARGVLEMLRRMQEAGDIYKDTYEGWYCTGCEAFYPETQLQEGHCPDGHDKVERLEEESWFFRLSAYEKPLLEHFEAHPEFVEPAGRRNEVVSFVRSGLEDLSVSRLSVGWGIPWPDDPDHVLYVWLDALSNYVTALGFGSEDPGRFERYWPADVHLIGKEILRFHAVYWPAFLMSAGLPLPREVFAHGWLLAEGKKMSKSFGNVLEPSAYLSTLGADALRYCLLRDVSFGQDGSFSDEGFIERFNADLANDLGNLLSRLTKMIDDWFPTIPGPHGCSSEDGLRERAEAALAKYRAAFDRLELHMALRACWELVGAVNQFIDTQEPWNLRKDESKRDHLGGVLYAGAEALRWIAVMVSPVMPAAGRRIFRALGLEADPGSERIDRMAWGDLPTGGDLGPRESLFPRLDKAGTMERIAQARKEKSEMSEHEPPTKADPEPTGEDTGKEPFPEGGDPLDISEFQKLDLRVGHVVEAERVEGADKLLVLKVDLGTETRQIVSGIRPDYTPEDLEGKHIIVVANLKPATIRGVRSEGMLLAASDGNKVVVAGFDRSVSPGSTVS